ncbi:MAG TPA: SIS domain-containing protein [Vicinamibacterales bacterium]
MEERRAAIDRIFAETIRVHEALRTADQEPLLRAIDAVATALNGGQAVLAFGNGGSAADAQHFAAELVGRFERERRAVPVLALTTDTSALTAIGNDYGFDQVFARQIEAFGAPGDVAIALTTSGRSPNVLAGLEAAQARGLTTIALTGRDGGEAGRMVDIHLHVPHESTARVQEAHRTLLHVICALVEEGL